jgi:predicted metal-dependent peptidase
MSAEAKLAAARTRLILDRPFLGALALRLPMLAAGKWCTTTATDAKSFYYSPDYIDGLSIEQTQFVLAHEALHCALSHFARRQHRVKFRWDIACDHAINPILVDDGLSPPPGVLILSCFEGMTAEEIYPNIVENSTVEPLDQNFYGNAGLGEDENEGGGGASDGENPGGASRPPPPSDGEQEILAAQWQQRLAAAAQQAQQAGKLGGQLARMVGALLQPRLPWRMVLARYMNRIARDDFSYMRPSRREGQMILPSLRSAQADVAVVLDTSGSVSLNEMNEFLAEIDAIKGQLRARITLHACDNRLAEDGPWFFEPWEEFRLPSGFEGGGGTDFRPVFEWMDCLEKKPDLLLYFTDAAGEFPDAEPAYPVIWLVKGGVPVPWGERIQLN